MYVPQSRSLMIWSNVQTDETHFFPFCSFPNSAKKKGIICVCHGVYFVLHIFFVYADTHLEVSDDPFISTYTLWVVGISGEVAL